MYLGTPGWSQAKKERGHCCSKTVHRYGVSYIDGATRGRQSRPMRASERRAMMPLRYRSLTQQIIAVWIARRDQNRRLERPCRLSYVQVQTVWASQRAIGWRTMAALLFGQTTDSAAASQWRVQAARLHGSVVLRRPGREQPLTSLIGRPASARGESQGM